MVFRIIILFFTTLIGLFIGFNTKTPIFNEALSPYIYGTVALLIGSVFIWLELKSHQAKPRKLFIATVAMIMGLFVGQYVGELFSTVVNISSKFTYVFQLLLGYFGFTIGWLKEEEIKFSYVASPNIKNDESANYKILDTSVIIDGRISDIAETGFLEGILVVPKFVLNELHQVADSSDPLKRSRGRRGLDILNNMKASKKAVIKITEEDYPDVAEVDSKLLKLARYMKAVIVTNDFNLNKVAEFEGVNILNINELSNAVKPVVLPNEELKIVVIKEGKDQNQGIAYLDDGTMIVIDNGRGFIGQEVTVVVTSILQTPAGRMIFTQLSENQSKKSPQHSQIGGSGFNKR